MGPEMLSLTISLLGYLRHDGAFHLRGYAEFRSNASANLGAVVFNVHFVIWDQFESHTRLVRELSVKNSVPLATKQQPHRRLVVLHLSIYYWK